MKDVFELENDSRAIAEIIAETDTDQRTILFGLIALLLDTKYDQHFTASLFKLIAKQSK